MWSFCPRPVQKSMLLATMISSACAVPDLTSVHDDSINRIMMQPNISHQVIEIAPGQEMNLTEGNHRRQLQSCRSRSWSSSTHKFSSTTFWIDTQPTSCTTIDYRLTFRSDNSVIDDLKIYFGVCNSKYHSTCKWHLQTTTSDSHTHDIKDYWSVKFYNENFPAIKIYCDNTIYDCRVTASLVDMRPHGSHAPPAPPPPSYGSSGWTVQSKHYCNGDMKTYRTLSAAKSACARDSRCHSVYDSGCDGGGWETCKDTASQTSKSTSGSCMYLKATGGCQDKPNTGFSISGRSATCHDLREYCNSRTHGTAITKACCNTCSGH